MTRVLVKVQILIITILKVLKGSDALFLILYYHSYYMPQIAIKIY